MIKLTLIQKEVVAMMGKQRLVVGVSGGLLLVLAVLAMAQVKLLPGRELTYTGAASFKVEMTGTKQPMSETRVRLKLSELVLDVKEGEGITIASLRSTEMEVMPAAPGAPRGDASIKVVPLDSRFRLKPDKDMGVLSAAFVFEPLLPAYAIGEPLKIGTQWQAKEAAPVMTLPALSDAEPLTLNFRYRVIGEELVGQTLCWRLDKSVVDKLPVKRQFNLPGGIVMTQTVTQLAEKLWAGKEEPLVVKYERQGRFSFQFGKEMTQNLQQTISLTLTESREVAEEELADRRQQVQELTEIQKKLNPIELFSPGGNPEKAFAEVKEALSAFQKAHPQSPYQPVVTSLSGMVEAFEKAETAAAKRRQEREGQASNFIGKPAPDFNLPDLTGKKRTLAEFKGKTVVLNFFSLG